MKELPSMFSHCKANEDKDLNVLEFLVEHVSGPGQLIEGFEHDLGEEEEDGDKPHTPPQFHFEQQHLICSFQLVHTPVAKQAIIPIPSPVSDCEMFVSDYISNIFRPPIQA